MIHDVFFSVFVFCFSRRQCWGDNSLGQLGYQDAQIRGRFPNDMGDNLPSVPLGAFQAEAVESGENFNCAVTSAGKIKVTLIFVFFSILFYFILFLIRLSPLLYNRGSAAFFYYSTVT